MALSSFSSHPTLAFSSRISRTSSHHPDFLALLSDALAGSSLRTTDGDASGKGARTSKGQASLESGVDSSRKSVGTALYGIPRQRANLYTTRKDLPALPGVRPICSVFCTPLPDD
ncbi:hypothetical protein BOTBODRAFT_177238 [Botryobasidium botryosum FD-172 SS1]|uniref:Uncharacterized protein n=1 Tax=Botryobasidium botryosum (strain FD-172 SS1) TaxID=930990 RepID=A0A067MIB3_BOTB1|nr:hypothetical protein BOTBODRAFT_177238 [Botryobasidium botryosum FD-172 SS1]